VGLNGANDNSYPNLICFIRGTIDIKDLISRAENNYNDRMHSANKRFSVRRMMGLRINSSDTTSSPSTVSSNPDKNGSLKDIIEEQYGGAVPVQWKWDELGPSIESNPIEALSLTPDLLEMISEIRFWFNSKKWYEERNIPWHRGYGFLGPTGTGKTSLTRAIAQDLDLPVYVFDLSSMTNQDFICAWEKDVIENLPCMVVFEDFDAVFDGRKNIANSHGISFDCMLNCVDGVERASGVLLIISTNHPETLDPAILRPGRLDRQVVFKSLDADGRRKMASRIIRNPQIEKELVDLYPDSSGSEFQEHCIQRALALKYQERDSLKSCKEGTLVHENQDN
jgi:ABC-type dipeptide/oligopeptide/nickel transport system ATPase subunit